MKIKNWYFLPFIFIYLSCSKNELDIRYTQKEEKNKESLFSIVGNWKGKLFCPYCCNSEYDYELNILSFDKSNNSVKCELKISHDYKSEWLLNSSAEFKCKGVFKNNKLTLITTKLLKESSSSCKYCDGNEYKMVLQDDNSLKGTWSNSSTCDINTDTEIKLNKL